MSTILFTDRRIDLHTRAPSRPGLVGVYLNSLSPAELKEHQQKAAAARWGQSRKKSAAKVAERPKGPGN